MNHIEIRGKLAYLHLAGKYGGRAVIDKDDVPKVRAVSGTWVQNQGKAVVTIPGSGGRKIYLHRLLVDAVMGDTVVWANDDMLDCRRANLILTPRQTPVPERRYPGVHFETDSGKWRASIFRNGKRVQLGKFLTWEEAVAARKAAEDPDRGIYFDKAHGGRKELGKPWRLWLNGKHVGRYSTKELAREARDTGNYDLEGTTDPGRRNVYFKDGRWRAVHNKKHIGYFDTKEQAVVAKRAYLEKLRK